ncbi:SAM-dependent methyltransferase [Streptomyces sp. DSM 42041]|uniref:S-adenosyl-L-methionine-dependent methyltransferase n=1 Tax=Streptomyces hazeniae TaxID=3075538 RepID=A0ABU2NX37_9ACTN|nr:SAM-dependent methyltransferase [Streptomyces sp. DSM 42041]MDT0380552.1 SAM-dependent methyltransferase [Streptomyces sp. DSM 42041]
MNLTRDGRSDAHDRGEGPPAPALGGPAGLSPVALWTAQAHAAETVGGNPCLRDPLAAEFLRAAGATGGPPGSGPLQRLLPGWMVVRSRFFDDYLVHAAGTGCRQVVLLGAGLDTRAFRLPWPDGVTVFEVDRPDVHAFKERVLGGRRPHRARRLPVRADPTGSWVAALAFAGFDPGLPTVWLCETLLYHLEPGEVAGIVDAMGKLSPPGSALAAECVNAQSSGSPLVASFLDALAGAGLRWKWSLPDPADWWGRQGWNAEIADPFELPGVAEKLLPHLDGLSAEDVEGVEEWLFLVTGTR